VLVLLTNFFGYYFNHLRSIENKGLIDAMNRSGRLQTFSQIVAKESILLLNTPEKKKASAIRDSLAAHLQLFQQQQESLQKQIGSSIPPVPPRIFQIQLLLTTSLQYYRPLTAIAQELAQSDSSLLVINRPLYSRDLLYNEQKYVSLLGEI